MKSRRLRNLLSAVLAKKVLNPLVQNHSEAAVGAIIRPCLREYFAY